MNALYASNFVKEVILLTPEPIDSSLTILNTPKSPVLFTCVPPQNSLEYSPIDTTLTVSPYFSSNKAIAPDFLASSIAITSVVTLTLAAIISLTLLSI